jgi:hypothetical protein
MKPTPRIIELVAALLAAAAEPTAAGVKALPPVEAAIVDGVHPSLDAALGSAAARALPDSVREDREHMGGVFALASRAGGYVYSHGVGRRGRDALTIRLRVPAGASLVAIWHTHGAPGAERRLFSPEDTRLAEALGVPIYLALPDGSLRVFAAGDPKLPRSRAAGSGLAALRGAAAGRAVAPPAARERVATACARAMARAC